MITTYKQLYNLLGKDPTNKYYKYRLVSYNCIALIKDRQESLNGRYGNSNDQYISISTKFYYELLYIFYNTDNIDITYNDLIKSLEICFTNPNISKDILKKKLGKEDSKSTKLIKLLKKC